MHWYVAFSIIFSNHSISRINVRNFIKLQSQIILDMHSKFMCFGLNICTDGNFMLNFCDFGKMSLWRISAHSILEVHDVLMLIIFWYKSTNGWRCYSAFFMTPWIVLFQKLMYEFSSNLLFHFWSETKFWSFFLLYFSSNLYC